MAKTAKLKKKQAAPHSRAARRAASPSIPLPKDVAAAPRRSTSPSRPSETKHHVLSAHSAGVSKKRNTKLTRAQRVRAEKAMERAADDMDKWELKKQKSIEKAGMIKGRAKVWEDVNEESEKVKRGEELAEAEAKKAKKEKKGSKFVADEEMGEVEGGVVEGAAVEGGELTGSVEAVSVAPPVGEDELL